jgi:hypothetical protein
MIHAQAQAADDTKKFHETHLLPKSKQTPLKQQFTLKQTKETQTPRAHNSN